ncbi:MAG: hypothetical protein K6G73_05615 [Marinilabiliaceae bacterium]|nr:hypothetical protein [Marinilabiliaceae bacterium]
MKKIKFTSVLLLAFLSYAIASAQQTISIKADKSTRPLIEKWVEAYKVVNPDVKIEFVAGKNAQSDLTLVSVDEGVANVVSVGRYALLPVTTTENPLISDIQKREWKEKDIQSLFFVADDIEDDYDRSKNKKNNLTNRLTVYSGNSRTSTSVAFAAKFDHSVKDFRGKKIAGDDVYLLSAIAADKESVTFGALENIYDLQTRALRPDLAILPLSVKKNLSDALANGTLDDVIRVVESHSSDLVVVGNFGFVYNNINSEVDAFLSWVLSDGQTYNNESGFLRLSEKQAQTQLYAIANHQSKLWAHNNE